MIDSIIGDIVSVAAGGFVILLLYNVAAMIFKWRPLNPLDILKMIKGGR